jgi:hypothetical protein
MDATLPASHDRCWKQRDLRPTPDRVADRRLHVASRSSQNVLSGAMP